MPDNKSRGLYGKYRVERVDGKPIKDCIVLELDDPLTWEALRVWADHVRAAGYEALADDVVAKVSRYQETEDRRLRAHGGTGA